MKAKSVLMHAALLTGVLLLNDPLSATVESPIVGYTTVTTSPGFNMLGVVFNGLGGQTLTLNDIVSGDFQDNDKILIRKDGRYYTYTYYDGYGWWDESTGAEATEPCSVGTAFWLETPGRSVEVTLKGAVPTGEYQYTSTAGFQMISMATPRELDLNTDVTWSGLTDGDEIQIRKDGRYYTYTYYDGYGWWDESTGAISTTKVQAGSSLWLRTHVAGSTLIISGI